MNRNGWNSPSFNLYFRILFLNGRSRGNWV